MRKKLPMLYGIAAAFIVIVVVLVVIIATRPTDFRVTRRTTIAASPAVVFALVNDFHEWAKWSPWDKMDPSMERTFDGSPSGVNAVYAWTGNSKVGEGRMTILESKPAERIRIELAFIKPFKATNTAEFTFKSDGNKTAVEWSMSGKHNFIMKAICLVMDMDKMVGGDFEKGLAAMKATAETPPTAS
jgi:uncharacterized protein YndB with AHSA1/START domain